MQHNILEILITEIQKSEEIISEIVRKKTFHISLNKDENSFIHNLRNKIEDSNQEIMNILYNINNSDVYLIHSVRENLLNKLDQYHHILHFLKKEQKIFDKSSNDIVENSMNGVRPSK